jgi:hypothetical protein
MGGDCGMSYKERIGSVQVSAGAKTFPINYYDNNALTDTFGGKTGADSIREETEGVGVLRWRRGEPYKLKDGNYERATAKDINKVLSGPVEEVSRS